MSVLPEIVEECRPYLVYATHAVAFWYAGREAGNWVQAF
jgi:hypothetical protein